MRLSILKPRFIGYCGDGGLFIRTEKALASANGVSFLCPQCFERNGGVIGTHSVICWFTGVPPGVPPGPGRWSVQGTDFDDLTLTPSIQVNGAGTCRWHGYITGGSVTNAG